MVGCCAEPGEIVGFHVRADTKRAVTRAGENTDAQRRISASVVAIAAMV